ncbi:PREDICTED: uncharacterized protein LOC106751936 [Dinoponera quadriceps]|uniref:Uncharacterized protein LOC106751936 n=1 Tax=Dinoponera quadriceps TaxID=609295 RepID=A0A6P3YFQ0_DINQU|nr:PREDICTED: uncharacterized protein LOC106751936 [Dinoponera quadriceps]
MARKTEFMWMLLVAIAITQAKPLNPPLDESANEIDHGETSLRKNPFESEERQRDPALPTNEGPIATVALQTEPTHSAAGTMIDTTVRPIDEAPTTKPGPFAWFLTPLTQKIQFSPQSFLQDRLVLLREALSNLGINVLQNATAKQLSGPGGLVHFVGSSDSGFYTNRLEPAGFLGGNGWFANKGGILGGPGAILSTGSLLTDYPTAYRK